MSLFTVAECDEIIQALKTRLIEDPGGSIGSLSVAGRTVTYRSADDLEKLLRLWTRQRNDAVRAASSRDRLSMRVAKFS